MTPTERIFAEMKRLYPKGPAWRDSRFDCLRKMPFERRVITEMYVVEGEISNGGLAQLLWNTFFHWRTLLGDCKEGYSMLGLPEHGEALDEFWKKFEEIEAECEPLVKSAASTQSFGPFQKWMALAGEKLASDKESLFYSDSGTDEKREQWLEQNLERVFAGE